VSGVETSALKDAVLAWVETDADLELRRVSDGERVVLCCDPDRAAELLAQGAVVFTPAEVLALAEARASTRDEGELADVRAFVARVVDAKRAVPGLRFSGIERGGSQ